MATRVPDEGRSDGALIGMLVHRLFQAASRRPAGELDRALAAALIRPEEKAVTPEVDRVLDEALTVWTRLSHRPEVAAILESADVFAEVPFSLYVDDGVPVVLRGTIDCLAMGHGGTVTVVEFKTGARRDEHQRQLDLYVRAARVLFPMRRIEGVLIYA